MTTFNQEAFDKWAKETGRWNQYTESDDTERGMMHGWWLMNVAGKEAPIEVVEEPATISVRELGESGKVCAVFGCYLIKTSPKTATCKVCKADHQLKWVKL